MLKKLPIEKFVPWILFGIMGILSVISNISTALEVL